MIGQVYDLLNLVWKTYHFSPKSMRELRELGTDIGVNVNAPSGVKGTRWLPHVSRSLETFLKQGKDRTLQSPGQFTAVYLHMDHLTGASANAGIAGRAKKVILFTWWQVFQYFLISEWLLSHFLHRQEWLIMWLICVFTLHCRSNSLWRTGLLWHSSISWQTFSLILVSSAHFCREMISSYLK